MLISNDATTFPVERAGQTEVIRVNNKYEVEWGAGMTVQDVLDALKFSFHMIVVRVNGEVVLRADFATTEVPDKAEIQAIHLISGG
jgi:thiamine biosynthesis protein ThiS